MNYNLAFFTNDYTLIDNSQNLINKQYFGAYFLTLLFIHDPKGNAYV